MKMPGNNAVIEFSGVFFAYGRTPVLEDITFSLSPDDFVSVVGPNGGGKTTLLKLMLGLIHPDKGIVRVFDMPPEKASKAVGYVPQNSQCDLQFPITVKDVVRMGRLGKFFGTPFCSRKDKEIANVAMNEVDIYDLRNRTISALSGGQRQRMLIARALASEPRMLLLDEPTAGVDMLREKEFYELLAVFAKRMLIVVVTHDPAYASKYVNKVICVNRTLAVHPTVELTGDAIHKLYGHDIRAIQHEHDLRHSQHDHGVPS